MAFPTQDTRTFGDIIKLFLDLIDLLLPVLAGLALLVFLKGLASFIVKSGDEASHREGRNLMVWGLLALFVMISYLSIIYFFSDDLGFGGYGAIPLLPQ
jgi:hypothetical protein